MNDRLKNQTSEVRDASGLTAAEIIEAARMELRFQALVPEFSAGEAKISYLALAQRKIGEIRNPLYQALLYRRGIAKEPWDQLAGEMNYSPRALQRFYHASLAQLQFVLDRDPDIE